MDIVRTALIGFGGMGKQYAEMLYHREIDGMQLVGICCRNAIGQATIRKEYPDVRIYEDSDQLFANATDYDALVIVTPHTTHVTLGKQAARLGKHILIDKPVGISTQEIKELLEITRENHIRFGVIFNMRAYPAYQKARELLLQNALGPLNRILWTCNNWYRSPAYHQSSAWRSSWRGEGGGLLINQCQHYFDMWQWLFGMPDSLFASIDYGKYNSFQVDDAADIQMYYRNGTHGTFITSSGESPGVNRLEIWGTNGKLSIENNQEVTLEQNIVDTVTFGRSNTDMYAMPEYTHRELPVEHDFSNSYQIIFNNFSSHLRMETPLWEPGADGLKSVMLANGAYLSSWTNKEVYLPFDDALYAALLHEKRDSE